MANSFNQLNNNNSASANPTGSFTRPNSSAVGGISPTSRRLGHEALEIHIPTTTTNNDYHDNPIPTQSSGIHQHPTSATSAYPPRGFQHIDRRRKADGAVPSPTALSPQVGFNAAIRASVNPHPTATSTYGVHESDVIDAMDSSSSLLRSKFEPIDEKDVGVRPTPILARVGSPRRRGSVGRRPSFSRSGRPVVFSWVAHFASILTGRRMRVLVLMVLAGFLTVMLSAGGDLDKVHQTVSHAPGYNKVQDALAWADTQRKGAAEAAGLVKDKALAWVGRPRPLEEGEQAVADEFEAALGGGDSVDELKEELAELEAELKDQRAKHGKVKAEAAAAQKAKEEAEKDLDFDLPPAAKLPTFDGDADVEDDRSGGKGQGQRPGAKTEGGRPSGKAATTGKDGSMIRMDDSTTFTYRNKFGGWWDSEPLSTSARAQSYTPPLGTPWDYSNSQIFGVNLGGWLTLEPFITPYLYEPFMDSATPAEDEWTLSENLGDDLAEVLENHYKTFITEKDFAAIAAAGLNWVRIPVPYWAIDPRPETEPFLPYVAWKYFIKSMAWARKYGIRINLDLHTAPGSQNGWNHSGKLGVINFMMGTMGLANAQRTLSIIRALAEFSSLPGNRDVIPMFSILNEPFWIEIGDNQMRTFYYNAYKMIRDLTGIGAGKGPQLAIHDGFHGTNRWYDYLRGADRLALDSHRYLCFMPPNDEPLIDQALKPCVKWAHEFNKTVNGFGISLSGEWSIAVNDCGRFLNAVGSGARFDGTFPNASSPAYEGVGSCDGWEDYETWDADMKEDLHRIALAHMDTFQNWFYWTWKTGKTITTGRIANPLWSYQLGLDQGWMPKDPRSHKGACNSIATAAGTHLRQIKRTASVLPPWQTGGVGAGRLSRQDVERYQWPPEELVGGLKGKDLPQYTQTGKPLVLVGGPTPTPTRMVAAQKGAEPPRRTAPSWVPIEGCDEYPEPWSGNGAPLPDRRKCGAMDNTGRD